MVDINLLHSIGTIVKFDTNQTVFMQNDTGSNMYIVLKGIFGVYINSFTDFPIRVAGIRQGSFFGEMSVIDGSPRSATIISEEDGVALSVEKDHFESLLEKCPDITASIINTLRNRLTSTAEAVRSARKEEPPLPPLLRDVQFTDAKHSLSFMTMMTQCVRQMNDLLVVPEGTSEPYAATKQPRPKSAIKLLPEGYVPFNLEDQYDTNRLLARTKATCPYCTARTNIFIPAFSRLVQKESTLDQRVIYNNFNILWYSNIVCPNCNYADSYQEFIKSGKSSAVPKYSRNQFENAESFTGFETPGKHTLDEVILSYYLRLECLERTSNDPLKFAKAWIRLYWLYSDNKSRELANQAAEKTRSFYSQYSKINDGNMSTDNKMRVNAILGELSVALNDFDQAMKYFKENSLIGRMLNNDLLKDSLKRYSEIKSM